MKEVTVIRQLRADEYSRLLNHPWLKAERIPLPENSIIVIAEEGEEIVGFWVAQVVVTCEPVWVHPERRKQGLGRELWTKLKELLKLKELKAVYTHSAFPWQKPVLESLGFVDMNASAFIGEL